MRVPQRTPDVTAADVERVVRRDFPPDQVRNVLTMLSEYGVEKWEREADRVRLAVLKLANRDLTQARNWIAQAKMDFRDVLSPAEYPLYSKKWGRMDRLTEEEQTKIIDADWAQYEKWFRKES
jgi:hypothetical protein